MSLMKVLVVQEGLEEKDIGRVRRKKEKRKLIYSHFN